MLHHPDKLIIYSSRIPLLARFSPFAMVLFAMMFLVESPTSQPWLKISMLFVFSFFCWRQSSLGVFRPYVIIGDSGVSWSTPLGITPSLCPWSQIEACARVNETDRRILRIFVAPETTRIPTITDQRIIAPLVFMRCLAPLLTKPNSRDYFDIDFDLADKPEQSLETAYHACAGWITATHGLAGTDSSIRGFGEVFGMKNFANARQVVRIMASLTIFIPTLLIISLIFRMLK
jgi:hypothetical protein